MLKKVNDYIGRYVTLKKNFLLSRGIVIPVDTIMKIIGHTSKGWIIRTVYKCPCCNQFIIVKNVCKDSLVLIKEEDETEWLQQLL